MSSGRVSAHRATFVGLLAFGFAGSVGLLASRLALAAAIDPAHVRLAPALIDDMVRRFLPLDLILPGPIGGSANGSQGSSEIVAAIVELKYCGASQRGTGRFRAVIRFGPAAGAGAPILVGDDGCRQSLGDLAKRAPTHMGMAGAGAVVSVADLEAVWRPWELHLILIKAQGPTPPRPGPPQPLAGAETRSEVLVVSTAGVRIAAGPANPFTLHLAPAFAADSVEIVGFWGDGGVGPPPLRSPPHSAGGAGGTFSGGVNAIADLPFGFANQVLQHFFGAEPLAIRIDREVVEVQNPSVAGSGSGSGVTATALATVRSLPDVVRVTVQTVGGELRVAAVRAEAPPENCSGLVPSSALVCNRRNAGRSAAASVFGGVLSQKYQGQLVRDLAGAQDLRVDTSERRLQLDGDLLHVGPSGRGFTMAARLLVGGRDH